MLQLPQSATWVLKNPANKSQACRRQGTVIPVSSLEARLASGSTGPTKQSTPFSAASAFSLQHRQNADGQAAIKGNLGDIIC